MASEEDIARLRRVTDTVGNTDPYSDEVLSAMIDQLTFEGAAGAVWQEKAASFASLVDTTESGSSRRLSQLQEQALKMSKIWTADEGPTNTGGGSFTVEIERV